MKTWVAAHYWGMDWFSASLPQSERYEIKHNHSNYITRRVRVNVVMCNPYFSCVCVFLLLVAMEKCVLLWKQLKSVQNHHCSLFGVGNYGYYWKNIINRNKKNNTPKDFSVLGSWIRVINNILLQKYSSTAKAFRSLLPFLCVYMCVF